MIIIKITFPILLNSCSFYNSGCENTGVCANNYENIATAKYANIQRMSDVCSASQFWKKAEKQTLIIRRNQVLFLHFVSFDWFNSHYQRLDLKQKFTIHFKSFIKLNLVNSDVTRLISTKYKIHIIKQYHLISKNINQINLAAYQTLSYEEILFLSYRKVQKTKIPFTYLKERDHYWLKKLVI